MMYQQKYEMNGRIQVQDLIRQVLVEENIPNAQRKNCVYTTIKGNGGRVIKLRISMYEVLGLTPMQQMRYFLCWTRLLVFGVSRP